MIRFLALLGLHFLVSFALLPDNVLVSHPVHHDDYSNLATGIDQLRGIGARPVSSFVIAAVADLGPQFAYAAQNLLVVLCVWLALRFVELYVRDGRPLPLLGYAAAAILAFSAPSVVDWTKYLGLLTNLSSAVFGLAAMCVMAAMRVGERRFAPLAVLAFALVALSFLAKEDFALPLLLTAAGIALSGGGRRWAVVTAAIGLLFTAALAYNRLVGSVFVSGTKAPDDPYFISLAPASLWKAFAQMAFEHRYSRGVLLLALATIALAVLTTRERGRRARLALLPAIALSLLAPYSIFPNHAFLYYGFLPAVLLAAAVASGGYATLRRQG